ncbi:RNA-guided endonuclease InsQ/TnpB family protein [Proteiniphilum sp. UBA5463]|jgi:IS605 OrfB family transposase|uniref:RNA-guided endonuclease InsQ/TnpB family protein n=1 Tax=Proteiniphilum sp. UBA5463 TaxID=1947281 RepID=UPI00257A71D5|nr:transposase [Proteiniphilum sp. UBA5463]
MKLKLKIKLLPTSEQAGVLIQTMREANAVCNAISDVAWQNKVFNQFKIHNLCYHGFKSTFNLSSQMLVRCIGKVADAYKLDKKTKRMFKPLGGIAYDSRIMTYKSDSIVSLWCIGGRQKIKFVCHNQNYMPYIKGEADLVYKKGKFYLFQTVDVPDEDIDDVEDFIGVDFGLTDIIVTSDGKKHTAETLNNYREHRQKVRSSIQRKGTRSSKRLLKRLKGKERTTATIINHTISKSIVQSAKMQGKGISVEDLTNIRFTSKRRNKKFRVKLGRWSFGQLRSFIDYKARLNGVKFVVVEPAYTSQTCSVCHSIGTRKNKSFTCTNCGNDMDADFNAAKNIATLGAAVNQPEKSGMYCLLHTA